MIDGILNANIFLSFYYYNVGGTKSWYHIIYDQHHCPAFFDNTINRPLLDLYYTHFELLWYRYIQDLRPQKAQQNHYVYIYMCVYVYILDTLKQSTIISRMSAMEIGCP